MSGKIALVFPGQGSQTVGMGKDLYEASAEARAVYDTADETLGFSLSRLCFEGPEETLQETRNAQPAIFITSIACLRAAAERGWPAGDGGVAFVAGHSLGEYTALMAAGALAFPEALGLVRERGRLMQEAGKRHPGTMAAIMGLEEEAVREVCRETGAEIANLNSPEQAVVSGGLEAVARAMALAKARGARNVVQLRVSAAFHSSLMQEAAQAMERALSSVSLRTPQIPVVGNVTAQPLTSPKELTEELHHQMLRPVQWRRSVEWMIGTGVETFVELGPGRVLSGLIRRMNKDVALLNIGDVASLRHLGEGP